LNVLLEKATRKLGELNAFTLIVPNIDLFIQMHIIKEANTSSKIEGINHRGILEQAKTGLVVLIYLTQFISHHIILRFQT